MTNLSDLPTDQEPLDVNERKLATLMLGVSPDATWSERALATLSGSYLSLGLAVLLSIAVLYFPHAHVDTALDSIAPTSPRAKAIAKHGGLIVAFFVILCALKA